MKISFLANTHGFGGGERSTLYLVNQLAGLGHDVTLHPSQWPICNPIKEALDPRVAVGAALGQIEDFESDLFVFYANNLVMILDTYRKQVLALANGASRSVCVLNFTIGRANQPWFYERFDQFIFLNNRIKATFTECTECTAPKTVLAPPVCLTPFLGLTPHYEDRILVRHSSRWKFDNSHLDLSFRVITEMTEFKQYFMGYPEYLKAGTRHCDQCRFWDFSEIPVAEFLELGSVFWYKCARRVADQGPRVVVEAMASGLACIVDNRDGMADRVTDETGWKCDSVSDYMAALAEIRENPAILSIKGQAARRRAVREFNPNLWITALLGTEDGTD